MGFWGFYLTLTSWKLLILLSKQSSGKRFSKPPKSSGFKLFTKCPQMQLGTFGTILDLLGQLGTFCELFFLTKWFDIPFFLKNRPIFGYTCTRFLAIWGHLGPFGTFWDIKGHVPRCPARAGHFIIIKFFIFATWGHLGPFGTLKLRSPRMTCTLI